METIPGWAYELVTSAIFIAGVFVARTLLIRVIRRQSEILSKEQRRWINRIRNGAWVLVLIGLMMIWSTQIHTFALSITAFAVALVVATKEMILCLMGSLFRVSTQPYKVGDWVIIDNVRGEVMDIDAFTTKVQEIEAGQTGYQFTGKVIAIPNGKLFTATVENANFSKNYMFQDLSVTVPANTDDPAILLPLFRDVIEKHTAPGREDAQKYIRRVERKSGVDLPDADPQVSLKTSDLGHVAYKAKIFTQTKTASDVAALITADFLSLVYQRKQIAEGVKTAEQNANVAKAGEKTA